MKYDAEIMLPVWKKNARKLSTQLYVKEVVYIIH